MARPIPLIDLSLDYHHNLINNNNHDTPDLNFDNGGGYQVSKMDNKKINLINDRVLRYQDVAEDAVRKIECCNKNRSEEGALVDAFYKNSEKSIEEQLSEFISAISSNESAMMSNDDTIVTGEFPTKVVTACILRKACEVDSLWSKWVLLSSLHILYGEPPPFLDKKQFIDLQGEPLNFDGIACSNTKLPTSSTSFKENNADVIECGIYNIAGKNNFNNNELTKNCDPSIHPRYVSTKDSSTQSQIYTPKVKSPIRKEGSSSSKSKKHSDKVEVKKDKRPRIKNVGIQCTPLKMGLLKNKREQTSVKNKTTSSQTYSTATSEFSTQTKMEELKEVNVQTESAPLKCNYTQTYLIGKREKESQTVITKFWNLIEISELRPRAVRRKHLKVTKIMNSGSPSIKLFYGRPLIGATSKLGPQIIPIQPLVGLSDFEVVDPRIKTCDQFLPVQSSFINSNVQQCEYEVPSKLNTRVVNIQKQFKSPIKIPRMSNLIPQNDFDSPTNNSTLCTSIGSLENTSDLSMEENQVIS